ncbi:peptidase inhibitor family I36 protein [Micromonospora sp. WMMA1923]|uniref:peptidase inhibitor family I36 protein n=1 Tax=Micromonospora sp. WMMA1923 TaxID=3404125 RepID=UPI003B931FDA
MSMRNGVRYALTTLALTTLALTGTAVVAAATPAAAAPATGAVATAAPATGAVVIAAPATDAADTARAAGDCPFSRTVCLFDQTGYQGTRFTASSTTSGGTCVSLVSHGFGDRARSVLNGGNSSAALFALDNCAGGPYQVAANSGIADLGTFRPNSVWVP